MTSCLLETGGFIKISQRGSLIGMSHRFSDGKTVKFYSQRNEQWLGAWSCGGERVPVGARRLMRVIRSLRYEALFVVVLLCSCANVGASYLVEMSR